MLRSLFPALVAVVAVALVLTGCSSASHRAVEAYVEPGDDAVQRVQAAASGHATTIGIDGVTLRDDGSALLPPPDGVRALASAATDRGAHAELLLSNYSSTVSDFSPQVGTALLSSAQHRASVAHDLAVAAQRVGADGVQIDLESLRQRDQAGLVAFAERVHDEVRAVLGADGTVSMAVMASTNADEYHERGYDLRALAAHVDRFVLMTYDQHGTWSGPGTVGASPWAEDAATSAIASGALADRLDLGVAGYGYSWPARTGDAPVTPARARALAGDRATWSDRTGEWSATLADGRELHWADARSYAARRDLAERLGLHGVAMWSLNHMPLPRR